MYPSLRNPMDCSLPGFSVHGSFQARVLLERERSDSVIATLCYLECIVKRRDRCKERKKYEPYTGKNSQIKFSERVQLLEILDRVQYSLTYIPLYTIYHGKSWITGKDPDAGKDWRWEEKGTTEDEMVGWHHQLNGYESEQTPGDSEGQRSPVRCRPWSHKESDTAQRLNTTTTWQKGQGSALWLLS